MFFILAERYWSKKGWGDGGVRMEKEEGKGKKKEQISLKLINHKSSSEEH